MWRSSARQFSHLRTTEIRHSERQRNQFGDHAEIIQFAERLLRLLHVVERGAVTQQTRSGRELRHIAIS
jgi:hypothetical protein